MFYLKDKEKKEKEKQNTDKFIVRYFENKNLKYKKNLKRI